MSICMPWRALAGDILIILQAKLQESLQMVLIWRYSTKKSSQVAESSKEAKKGLIRG